MRYGLSSASSTSIVSAESGTTTRTGLAGTGCENRTRCLRHTPWSVVAPSGRSSDASGWLRWWDRRFAAIVIARIWVWIYPRTAPRIADPGFRAAVVRCSRGLVACLERESVVDGNCGGGVVVAGVKRDGDGAGMRAAARWGKDEVGWRSNGRDGRGACDGSPRRGGVRGDRHGRPG